MAFFSIICPVYNSQNTLERTINSVLNQSFEDWELILIDDGSTDESALLCDNYLKHNNIKVIHQSNQGPLLAREAGIKIATGEFLLFLDDDDTFELNALNIIHNKLAESNADVLIYKRKRVYPDKPTEVLKPEQIRTNYLLTNVKEIIKHCYVDNIFNYLTEKCFKKSLYKHVEIPEKLKCSRYEEDTLISYLVIKDAKRVMFVKDILYIQHANENSITHNLNVYDYKMCYEIYKFIYQDMIDIGINITNYSFFNNVLANYLLKADLNKKEFKDIQSLRLTKVALQKIEATKIQAILLHLLKKKKFLLFNLVIYFYRNRKKTNKK